MAQGQSLSHRPQGQGHQVYKDWSTNGFSKSLMDFVMRYKMVHVTLLADYIYGQSDLLETIGLGWIPVGGIICFLQGVWCFMSQNKGSRSLDMPPKRYQIEHILDNIPMCFWNRSRKNTKGVGSLFLLAWLLGTLNFMLAVKKEMLCKWQIVLLFVFQNQGLVDFPSFHLHSVCWHPAYLVSIGHSHKSHNAPVPYPTMQHLETDMCTFLLQSNNAPVPHLTIHHFGTEMGPFLFQSGVLWDIGQVHCGICEMGLSGFRGPFH